MKENPKPLRVDLFASFIRGIKKNLLEVINFALFEEQRCSSLVDDMFENRPDEWIFLSFHLIDIY